MSVDAGKVALDEMTKKELLELAREKGVKGVTSKSTNAQLIAKINAVIK